MSYCRREGKDTVMFMTKEDLEKPSTVQLPEPEPAPGLINQDGSINWNCPCLGGMATGPCGVEFREAFQCFHYSTAEPKGSECFSAFQEMQDCMSRYPKVYDKGDKEEESFSMDDKSSIDDSKESDNSANSSKVDKKK